ncbi:DUF1869 domain-containing protein [Shigella sonnei]
MGKATYTVTITHNSNGILSIMKQDADDFAGAEVAAEVMKDLVNTVRSYDTENEHDVCASSLPPIVDGAISAPSQNSS